MKRKREFTPAIKKQRTPKTKPAPKRQVVYRPIEALIPYARNARTHSDEQVAQIAASIREFGWTNPVLVDEQGGIIAGHGRVLAARKLGLIEAPTIELDGLTEAQRRAYVLADNKLALNAGWDDEMLRIEFAEIDALPIDLELTGFSEGEIAALLKPAEEPDTSPQLGDLQYKIMIDCENEERQAELLSRFDQEGIVCRALTL